MPQGSNRVKDLDPLKLLAIFGGCSNDEEIVKRKISAFYFGLFNYWAAIEFFIKGHKAHPSVKSPFRDQEEFPLIKFESSVSTISGLIWPHIVRLATYRIASDHRVSNPVSTLNYHLNGQIEAHSDLKFTNQELEKVKISFTEVRKALKNTNNV